MRAVIQRVSRASVTVDGVVVASIGHGLLVLVGVAAGDAAADIAYVAAKIRDLRIFPDEAGRMSRSVVDTGGQVLVVSQFTLLGDTRKGRRPAFDAAEHPTAARQGYEALIETLHSSGVPVASGQFQAHMDVALVNDGPVTLLVDSRKLF